MVGMVELIIGGILDLIAKDLHISISQAGNLITIFSLILALTSPILLFFTAGIERKKLIIVFLFIFLVGNIITVMSPNYTVLFIGRIISAGSAALLIVLCLISAPYMVEPQYRGRAIGIVSMGTSASLVLGIPIGIILGQTFGWRAPLIFITILTILSILGVFRFMNRIEPRPAAPLHKQLDVLKDKKILFAHGTTFLYMSGHTLLYAYFTPYIVHSIGLKGVGLSIIYLVFGISAVSGGAIGGKMADVYGTKRTILSSLMIFSVVLLSISYSARVIALFLTAVILWGILSWAISPAMQSYLIETSPETSDIQQSLSNSALHLGIAFGSFAGGIVINKATVAANPYAAAVLIILSFITAMLSMHELPHQVLYKEK